MTLNPTWRTALNLADQPSVAASFWSLAGEHMVSASVECTHPC